ncbi:nucleolar protein 56 [Methanohalophilus levihalophilus]|uniref:NOP5/NOP56 family protein n=1 Tax=Methanohalophilus levihalophilus TaxID=1431282 RepID=UPI001AEBA285|nr:NOP5/NOP56 family protein [Methanohalophilus levihalophilus]MBP2030006.1 nucleolar protein 56 [Methanohalophilus levihalophilus]
MDNWFGEVEISDDGDIEKCNLSGRDPKELAERIRQIQKKANAFPAGVELRELARKCDFAADDSEYLSILQQACVEAARESIKESYTPDLPIIHAVGAIDDVDEAVNLLAERLSVWYGDHFPELDLKTFDLASFVETRGLRDDVSPDDAFYELTKNSMGCPMNEKDGLILKGFAGDISSLYERRSALEQYIRDNMEEVAPNLCYLAGPLLGARLMSMAGSLKKLASMPSSTVQVIGANNALFKHLRSKAPSPKHGIIFNHPLVKSSSPRNRGKISRALAAKISLAARTDAFSGEFHPSIKDELDKKVASIESRQKKEAHK